MKIIDYIPRRSHSVITYIRERIDEKHLTISPANYKVRKKIMEEHIDAVIRYAESADRCRSAMLLEYFGERNAKPCGQCDYCIRHEEREITKAEWDVVENELRGTTEEDIAAISQKTGINEHKVIEIIRQIRDNE
jgi:ATP-dependent DNA helicase RecQ